MPRVRGERVRNPAKAPDAELRVVVGRELRGEDQGLRPGLTGDAEIVTSERVNVLTHCNAGWLATVDWGTATAPIYMAHDKGIPLHVFADETRPRNQGASLTAWELGKHGVAHTVIPDNTGGHLMQHGLVDMVIVGTDRVTAQGDVCNKIGTYLKALAAKDNNVPFYVGLPSPTIDWTIEDGVKEIPIEERDAAERKAREQAEQQAAAAAKAREEAEKRLLITAAGDPEQIRKANEQAQAAAKAAEEAVARATAMAEAAAKAAQTLETRRRALRQRRGEPRNLECRAAFRVDRVP